jgi:hypothetical protein
MVQKDPSYQEGSFFTGTLQLPDSAVSHDISTIPDEIFLEIYFFEQQPF